MIFEKVSRSVKLERQLLRIISDFLRSPILDNRYTMVNITSVSVSRDLKNAKIYYTSMEDLCNVSESSVNYSELFTNDIILFRSEIAKNLQLKYMPKITFIHDDASISIKKVNRIIDGIKKDHA